MNGALVYHFDFLVHQSHYYDETVTGLCLKMNEELDVIHNGKSVYV